MRRGILLQMAGLLAGAAAQAGPAPAQGLHALAVRAGLQFFGTATDTNNFNDTAYMNVVNNKSEFGILTPENSQKWEPTEPRQGAFVFTNPDQVRSLAVKNTQQFRCHTLTWFEQLPQFVQTTQWTRETLTAAIRAHITNVVTHYRGQCYSWDVVNEAINDNGTFRESVFFRTLGTDYIPISFDAAARADPQAKLYYNDFSLEFNSNKTDTAVRIVKLVQDAKLRIDGVGFQAHMVVGQTPPRATLVQALSRFTALGLEVALTELDVRQPELPASNRALEQQSADYASMVAACLNVAKCVGVVVWQFTDKYSWVPSTFPGTGEACLFDQNFVKRPAYTAVAKVLSDAASVGRARVVAPNGPGLPAVGGAGGGGVAAGGGNSKAPFGTGNSTEIGNGIAGGRARPSQGATGTGAQPGTPRPTSSGRPVTSGGSTSGGTVVTRLIVLSFALSCIVVV